jgi:hypothetical protein
MFVSPKNMDVERKNMAVFAVHFLFLICRLGCVMPIMGCGWRITPSIPSAKRLSALGQLALRGIGVGRLTIRCRAQNTAT